MIVQGICRVVRELVITRPAEESASFLVLNNHICIRRSKSPSNDQQGTLTPLSLGFLFLLLATGHISPPRVLIVHLRSDTICQHRPAMIDITGREPDPNNNESAFNLPPSPGLAFLILCQEAGTTQV